MLKFLIALIFVVLVGCNEATVDRSTIPESGPIQLHPENPHYFLYRGQAMALVTSAEHYGSVLNLDFDYVKYLETLASEGMNYTRIFTGTYFEIAGESFGIMNNTLAPEKNRVITPWAVVISDLSGEVKYDLSTWNEAYFNRLKNFLTLAAEKNIIVEVTLFSSIYRDAHWDICPQNPENNVNISHEISRLDAQTLNNGDLIKYQVNFVRKMVNELNGFDNFFFEIQNEPWADHPVAVYNIVNKEDLNPRDWTYKADFATETAMAWQDSLISAIVEAEKELPKIHLIAQNYTNFKAPVPYVNEDVSIINFHYAWPEAVEWNYHYNKVIGFDESGFAGSSDQVYRRQAWQFMMSGGGLFNSLDYSFFVGNEDGKGENSAPGGGSTILRKQLKILSEFINGSNLEKMYPDNSIVISSPGLIPYILTDHQGTFAVYLRAVGTKETVLKLETGVGNFTIRKINTITGEISGPQEVSADSGIITIDLEIPDGEMALKISKK